MDTGAYTYFYSYGVGGLIFFIGLYYGYRNGYIGFSGHRLRNLLLALCAIGFYAALQGYLQFGSMKELGPEPFVSTPEVEAILDKDRAIRGSWIDYVIVAMYFGIIMFVGTMFGKRQKTSKDFFFGGQRFAWWLISISLVATVLGAYSFVKYGEIAYQYGMGSTQAYWNDWIWFPLLAFGWLPILYFSRIVSIPEYFGRRFSPRVRLAATSYMLIYLIGYVGVNLYTMGVIINVLVGWDILVSASIVAVISMTYVVSGGQTSIIMTDLFQGFLLMFAGLLILVLGAAYIGGLDFLWNYLPRPDRLAFPNFNEDPDFPAIGIFWQDGFANSAMFIFLHQGMMMRFMAAKSVNEGRKAALVMIIALMFLGALVVASGGLVARSFTNAGILPELNPKEAFFIATELLSYPGVFGLILAALTAALMSTVDTLITAIAAVTVNDLYQPYIRPQATEKQLLSTARLVSVAATITGVLLVPVFANFKTIYAAHAGFTAAVTPPLVIALLLSVFWKRFTRTAAVWVLIGGFTCIMVSLFYPAIIQPFAHGISMGDVGEGILAGVTQQQYMRAFYGSLVCIVIGIVVTLLTKPETEEKQRGLVWGTIQYAVKNYTGSMGREAPVVTTLALPRVLQEELPSMTDITGVRISRKVAEDAKTKLGDLIYITDTRWWTGGLFSTHAVVRSIVDAGDEKFVEMEKDVHDLVVFKKRRHTAVRVERLYESIDDEKNVAVDMQKGYSG